MPIGKFLGWPLHHSPHHAAVDAHLRVPVAAQLAQRFRLGSRRGVHAARKITLRARLGKQKGTTLEFESCGQFAVSDLAYGDGARVVNPQVA